MVPPAAQITGINEEPRAMFVSSVSSAIILFITPTFPLSMPFNNGYPQPIRVNYSTNIGHKPEDKRPERTGKAKKETRDHGT